MKPVSFMTDRHKQALQLLKQYWGYDSFRPLQADIIASVLEQTDTLAIMPTGGGKSICYQLPALMQEGICLVVSPLIALMKDQVEQLHRRHIAAQWIMADMPGQKVSQIIDHCLYGSCKFLYVSPERLQSKHFHDLVKQMNVCLIAVDEAHCISQWGYDFRPAYLKIADFIEQLSKRPPIIALTASATPQVQQDICRQLRFRQPHRIFRKSFIRPNLSYSVFHSHNKAEQLLHILQKVPASTIVYTHSRKKCESVAKWLRNKGLKADFYHAGLPSKERAQKQSAWFQNQNRIMVATNAFGMGIDKPDVRLVLHLEPPTSLEAYYQEAGRAGRDEKRAYAVLLYENNDFGRLRQQIEKSLPTEESIRRIYASVCNHLQLAVGSGEGKSFHFSFSKWIQASQIPPQQAYFALKALEKLHIIQLDEDFAQDAQLHIPISQTDLYDYMLRFPQQEVLLKGVLRLAGGRLLTEYVPFVLSHWAKSLNLAPETLHEQLSRLDQQGVLSYLPARQGSQITFLIPRHEPHKLPIAYQKLEQLKQNQLKQLASVEQYATQQHCRSLFIAHYFGEDTHTNCGKCDYCIQKRKAKKPKQQLEQLKEQVLNLLGLSDNLALDQLPLHIKHIDYQLLAEAIRELQQEGKIQINTSQQIKLCR